nr:MAG: hypothetical protein J07AB56_10440 [Candidatus Nanosalinarum sp. J07AB56]
MIILVGFPQTTKEHIAGSPSEDSQHRTELTGFGRAFGHTQLTLGVVTVVMDGADQSEEALKEKAKECQMRTLTQVRDTCPRIPDITETQVPVAAYQQP